MKRSQASYTVEASILIPLILAVILALIQICFMAHDRVLLIEALEYTALQQAESENELQEYVFPLEELRSRLLLSEVTDVSAKRSKHRVTVTATLCSRSIVPLYFTARDGVSKEFCCKRGQPISKTKTILCEVLLDTLEDLKGKGKE